MSPHPVELRETLDAPCLAARTVLVEILAAIERSAAPYERVCLEADVRGLKLPSTVRATAPIELRILAHAANEPETYHIAISGAQPQSSFPEFDGWLKIDACGAKRSEISLTGSYKVPYGLVGDGIDATIMHDVARKSLARFLQWIAAETAQRLERDERARNLYRHHM